ncbi:VOC family protein [Conexibacter sp. SYSU D00693]|uniref:VOC family protein n=1 Tax=Conexibacter sp. SYSU D00693 TaxID=2812560 RepID=UPI00196A346F|nr:VOC family protein [Conexibacter sp. SYSU D00693]
MLISGFQYDDADTAMEWLERALGFERVMAVPGEDGRSVAHAELRRGDAWVMVGSRRNDGSPYDGDVPYLVVDDVHAALEQARAAGAEVVDDLREESYGRFFGVRDPGGRVWSIGDYAPGTDT